MRRRTRSRPAALLAGVALGVALEIGAPVSAPVLAAGGWASQTITSLGLNPQSLEVVVTRAFDLEDYHTALAAGIPAAHVVFADQWRAVPPGSGVVVLGGTAATDPALSQDLAGEGDVVVQLGGATYLQTAAMFRAFLAGEPLGALTSLANAPPVHRAWGPSADPYAGQGQAYTDGQKIDGVSVALVLPSAPSQPTAPSGPLSPTGPSSPGGPPSGPTQSGAPPSGPPPTGVTLTANPTILPVGQASQLTATAVPAANPSWAVNIVDTTSNSLVTSCLSTAPCVVQVSEPIATSQTFEADIGPPGAMPNAPGVVAVSAPVSVEWVSEAFQGGGGGSPSPPPSPSIALKANPQTLWVGSPTTVTATATDVPAGDVVQITGSDGVHQDETVTTYTQSVSFAITDSGPASGGTVTYSAEIVTGSGSPVAEATPVNVQWIPLPTLSLSANPTIVGDNDPTGTTTLTVTATDLLGGDSLQITGSGGFPYSQTIGPITTATYQAVYQTTVDVVYLPPVQVVTELFQAQVLDPSGQPVPNTLTTPQAVYWVGS
ncbi:MAG: hypothetical protein K6U14_09095 [Firmicutes bacterium]|nr:hypothetical protein [Alicyclobacillaceae bacterium]MCL6497767.1 hypothetical protein [Bacillota bacterium]